jgi:adenylyl-sulfate kinase
MGNERGITLWFTGLSGAGKTTIAVAVEKYLKEKGLRVERLDGDLVREYLTRDLGFSRKDRDENILRVSYVAALLTRNGVITLCSFIAPYRQARAEARELIGSFAEVYVNAPLDVCENRDVKGLYQKARAAEIPEFTGVSDPYEPPENPEIELRTDRLTVEECLESVVEYLTRKGYLRF